MRSDPGLCRKVRQRMNKHGAGNRGIFKTAVGERYDAGADMSPQGERFLLIIMIGLFIAATVFALSGCGARYQPPGENLWRAL